jgi:hypothetical protein
LDRHQSPLTRRHVVYYRITDFFGFIQDTWRLARPLVLNLGVRYEGFGAPLNTGTMKDALVQLGAGPDLGSRVTSARLVRPGSGDQQLYDADHNDFAGRFGISYAPLARPGTVFRAGYGIFYDRIFDNAWQNLRNNGFVLPTAFAISAARADYLAPVAVAGAAPAAPAKARADAPAAGRKLHRVICIW